MFTAASAPTNARWPRAVVFDCDGLLVRSDAWWQAAYAATLEAVGASLADVDLGTLVGASVASAAQALTTQAGRPVDAHLLRTHLQASTTSGVVEAMPGAARLLDRLAGRLPLAVASNGPHDVVRSALGRCGLLAHFDTVVSAEQCAHHKPAPDVYLLACQQLGVDPSDAIALEDSLPGARAATAAGLVVIGVGASASTHADLHVGRLDDPRVLTLLGATA